MKIEVGTKLRIKDKEEICLGDDLTNGKTYEVINIFSDGSAAVRDDIGDLLPITVDEIDRAVEVVKEPQVNYERETLEKLESLLTQVTEFINEVRREHERKYNEKKVPQTQNRRKQVIEAAERFLKEKTTPNASVYGDPAIKYKGIFGVKAVFLVNEEKRTVTVLLRGAGDNKVLGKGISRCAPGDVFNAIIGKAIALGRAFDIDVSEFENAPQPQGVAIGQEFISSTGLRGKITDWLPAKDGVYGKAFLHTHDRGWLGEEQVIILADTDAIYE